MMNGWLRSWEVVIRFVGSHFMHYEIKSRASFGQLDIAVDNGIYE
jgi:hypothetical protein